MNIGLGSKRKTILLIDSDAHARAGLRTALEIANFTVGEATDYAEGQRTIQRIHPDAVLADLDLETIDSATMNNIRHQEAEGSIPFFIISAAADALVGSVDIRKLGIAGVFLKPADAAVIVRSLTTQLGC